MKNLSVFLVSLISVFLMLSCSGGTECKIDNPTNAEIKVIIDGNSPIVLAPAEYNPDTKISLKEGEHTMKVNDGDEIKFKVSGNTGLLNPTLSTYVFAKEEYSTTGLSNELTDTDIELDGTTYTGPFEKISEAFIPTDDVNLGIDQSFKSEISTHKTGVVIIKKIFRQKDFIDYFKPQE
ncbi:MAG: hypothetical protein FWF54_09950 [Candidatus Azobacteroides sp.]|nr:hypothetical protein [Candidatus Azobacteroides sp.]